MKTIDSFLKVTAALVAIGATIYAIAKYGDKLVALAKRLCPCCGEHCAPSSVVYEAPAAEVEVPAQAPADVEAEAPVEETPAEEADTPVEEEAAPAVEIPEGEPVAEEADFEE